MTKLFFLILIFFISSVYSQSPVPDDAELELIATGFMQPEGPIWNDSLGLLFSDIKANKIYRWNPKDSSITTYLQPSDSSNGLTYDQQGRLILTQMGKRRVSRKEFEGTITPLASLYNGKKFNSPNDLVVKSDGAIFFTDPTFNIPNNQESEIHAAIYRISPYGDVQLLDSTLELPNGICFSPDETKLYVNNSQARRIYVWDVVDDSTIQNKREFARINPSGYSDGMKVDSSGNLFCTGPQGVWIFSPGGTLLDTIHVPGSPSNCNWGDADKKTLYITGGSSLYRIRLASTTDIKERGSLPDKFELYQNYPNPFNPKTNIGFRISNFGFVSLKVYNVLGKEISTLINEQKPAGKYEVEFIADKISSGIYFYQLCAGNFTETKKLILLK